MPRESPLKGSETHSVAGDLEGQGPTRITLGPGEEIDPGPPEGAAVEISLSRIRTLRLPVVPWPTPMLPCSG
jgi:hypothetical protein